MYVSCLVTNFQQIQMRREVQIFTCSWDSFGTAVVDCYQLSIFNRDQHPFLKIGISLNKIVGVFYNFCYSEDQTDLLYKTVLSP